MPSRCVVAGCSNTTKNGVSLHTFPSVSKYRRIWTAAVKHTRPKWPGPTVHSMVCSAHFEPTCFDRGLYHQFDLTIKQMLLPDAVPTIFPLSKTKKAKVPQKKRGAFEKRERIRVSLSCIMDYAGRGRNLDLMGGHGCWRNTVTVCSVCIVIVIALYVMYVFTCRPSPDMTLSTGESALPIGLWPRVPFDRIPVTFAANYLLF